MTDTPRLNQPVRMTEAPQRNGTPRPAEPHRRRGPADPVLALMHHHYDLCARAVDPLEIAAGLEAHGVTDRAAARFRHRDVFSLAEELYARVPREPGAGAPTDAVHRPAAAPARLTARRILLHLLPGIVCAAGVVASHILGADPLRAGAIGAGVLVLVVLAARTAVRRGPLRARSVGGSALWTCWLLAYALYGAQALTALLAAGPSGPGGLLAPGAAAGFLARAFALLPAAWCARRFALRARERLEDSHGLDEFAAEVRPLLGRTLTLFALAVLALLTAAYAILTVTSAGRQGSPHPDLVALAGTALLGLLLFTAQLLAVHGFPGIASAGTGAACAVEAVALATGVLQRVPQLRATGRPLRDLVRAAGPGSVQAIACTAAVIALIACARPALSRVSAHATADHTSQEA